MPAARTILGPAAALAILLGPSRAPAQEIQITGPLVSCSSRLARPAVVEWSSWLLAGVGARIGEGRAGGAGVFGVGVEETTGIETFSGRREDSELRAGPWASALTDGGGVRGEGGLTILHATTGRSPGFAEGLRLGAGWGDDRLGRAPHWAGTLTLGFRSAPSRWGDYVGDCFAPIEPDPTAFVSGARLFLTTRVTLVHEPATQVTFGIELDPTFFSPPYSWRKLLGGEPERMPSRRR